MANIAPKTEKQPEAGAALIEKYEAAEDPDTHPVPETVAQEPVRPAETHAEPPAPKHPAWLARKAKQAGLDEAEIAGITTDDLKDQLLVLAEQRREVQQDRPRNDQGQFVKQEAPPEPAFEIADKRLDDFAPELRGILTDLTKPLVDEIKALKKQLADVGERDQVRERNAHFDKLDQLFNENEEQFGKGRRSRLAQDSKELARRVAVINEMGRIQKADPSIPFDESFEMAAERLDYVKKAAPPPAAPAPAKVKDADPDPHGFSNGKMLTPTNRISAAMPKGESAAKEFIREWRNKVTTPENGDEDEASLAD